jgi:hypothetical protein
MTRMKIVGLHKMYVIPYVVKKGKVVPLLN